MLWYLCTIVVWKDIGASERPTVQNESSLASSSISWSWPTSSSVLCICNMDFLSWFNTIVDFTYVVLALVPPHRVSWGLIYHMAIGSDASSHIQNAPPPIGNNQLSPPRLATASTPPSAIAQLSTVNSGSGALVSAKSVEGAANRLARSSQPPDASAWFYALCGLFCIAGIVF